ncbi:sensor histidine kinase, partial [Streptomyces shenzhenensis]
TNILRHAQARNVQITLSESGITITNDGAPHKPLPQLSGLAVLQQRLTAAAFPPPGPQAQETR